MIEVICINDANRPNEIPISRWVKKGQKYILISVVYMKMQGIYGCKIEEINNDDLFPYSYFAFNRFNITQETIERLIQKKEIELIE